MDEPSYKEIPFRNQHRGQRLQHHDPEQNQVVRPSSSNGQSQLQRVSPLSGQQTRIIHVRSTSPS
ncbi:hypothetical protein ACLOJK_004579, partial [Asimina triloba]